MDYFLEMENGNLNNREHRREKVHPERLFLLIAVIAGLAFALVQPLFIEPDASYHFDKSTYISNSVVDRAKIGFPAEDYQSLPVPFTTVSGMLKDGTYYKNFFKKKLPKISKDKVADKRAIGSVWYKDIMHVVPAIGVSLGHAIYPSVGVMVITARLLSLLFFIISMYFIIKKLKAYRMVFVVISISPVAIQMAASLSYDCFNYVACAWLIATLINWAIDIKSNLNLTLLNFISRFFLPIIAVYVSKSNSRLLYLLVILSFIVFIVKKLDVKVEKIQAYVATAIFFVAGASFYIFKYHDQLRVVINKFIYTFMEPYYSVLTTQVISGTSTVAVPAWFFPIQYAALVLLLLSYTKERVPRWFAWTGLVLNLLNVFGVLFRFAINPNFAEHVITGPQGRYFTVFLLLLAPIFTLLAQKITVLSSNNWLKRMVILISVLALVLNLGITVLKFYHLQVPMDEFRSGIEHYIFK
ncbi:DUF2142 domain-containing protein [Lactococcus taiwanensis]|uniref:DUF2142 domain-containing protein n=1 Tax=Lactococcus taiwanensis TaxID=1151742 RepID=UPI003D0E06C5